MPPLTEAEKAAIEEEKRKSDARIAKRLAMKKKSVNISRRPPKPSAAGRKSRMDAYLDCVNKKR